MPMAAVGILAMVLAVLATLNLGQAVHEKIKLQNTADSAAYTLAAMEARTFNYIAFLNRVQIAHYNTAMVVQSYITWVGFYVAVFGTAIDMLPWLESGIQFAAQNWCNPPYITIGCPYIPYVPVMKGIVQGAQAQRESAIQLYKQAGKLGHNIVEAMSIFNKSGVWQTQLARAAVLNGHIMEGLSTHLKRLDPDLSFSGNILNTIVNVALNSIEYHSAFDNASGVNPYWIALLQDFKRVGPSGAYTKAYKGGGKEKESAKDAWRIMSELCHATRTPQFVSNRLDFVAESYISGQVTSQVFGFKLGQTKFTEKGVGSKPEITAIRSETNYHVTPYLSSDDFLEMGGMMGTNAMPQAFGGIMLSSKRLGDAVSAYERNGKHYLYKAVKGAANPDGTTIPTYPPNTLGTGSKTSKTESHAKWQGFAPYFKFKPNKDRTRDYNQPSTWFFLNKHHKTFQSGGGSMGQNQRAPWHSDFDWEQGDWSASLDTSIGGSRNSYFLEGITVLSRGQAYYHRPANGNPGNWGEHPNFFNPFWRARLAPVGQKLQNFWDRYVTSKITSNSDNKVIKGAVNFLRNAQMDLFTGIITSVITH